MEQRELLVHPDYVKEIAPPKPLMMGRIINLEQFVSVIRLEGGLRSQRDGAYDRGFGRADTPERRHFPLEAG